MTRRKTHEEFVNEVFQLTKDEYVVVEKYTATHSIIKMFHNVCKKDFPMRPNKFLSGQRCSHCKNERISKSKTKSHLKFEKEFNDLRGKEYILNSEYKGVDKYIDVIHKKCNKSFPVTPNNFIHNHSGCPHCHGIKDNDIFNQQLFKIHGNEIRNLDEYRNNRTKILVQHMCGHKWKARPKDLLKGSSCPSCNQSKGEKRISKWLEQSNMKHHSQYTFDGLQGINGGLLSYDFYLIDFNVLIEYQGNFHDGSARQQKESEFQIQQEHDRRKREYTIQNNIKLLEIWYWDYENIEQILEKYIQQQNSKNLHNLLA